jgi:hypothetical protein
MPLLPIPNKHRARLAEADESAMNPTIELTTAVDLQKSTLKDKLDKVKGKAVK